MLSTKVVDKETLEILRYTLESNIVPISNGSMLEIDLEPHMRIIKANINLLFAATQSRVASHEVMVPKTWRDAWKEQKRGTWLYRFLLRLGWLRPIQYRVVRLEVNYRHLYPTINLPEKAYLHVSSIRVANS